MAPDLKMILGTDTVRVTVTGWHRESSWSVPSLAGSEGFGGAVDAAPSWLGVEAVLAPAVRVRMPSPIARPLLSSNLAPIELSPYELECSISVPRLKSE